MSDVTIYVFRKSSVSASSLRGLLSITILTYVHIAHCTPPNYSLLSFPRTSSKNTSSQAVGGGTGFLIREPFTQLPVHLTYWILLLRIVFCNSETASFKNIGLQYLSSTFIFHFLQLFFLMNLIHSFLLPLPHLMNSSSPATLTSTFIIIQTTLPVSFSLFCHHLT